MRMGKKKKERLSIWRQLSRGTEKERQTRERGLTFIRVAPSWTRKTMALNNFGKSFLATWQEAAEKES